MSMPYHKELLRSSVSLCFREFFVFRNKAKGVMTLLCQFEKMIYPSGTGAADAASFMIALYRPCEKLKDSSGNTITQIKAVGYCLPTAGNMRYEMRGHWRKDPKYGIQYDVEGYEEQIIPTREGIITYLSSGQIKGIGPKMAERIYDAFGNMALEVLDKKPEKLLTISGISQNKLKKICDSYLANRGARDVVAFLSPHGITPNRAVKLYKEYGEQTMDIVKNHPYKLCEMVGVGFKTADKIAMSMGIDRLSPERVDEGILYTLTDAEGYGNLCMERDGFIAACQKTLETPELTDQMIAARANRLILDGKMRTYESCVYREKTAKAEEKLANLIRYQIRHQNPCTYGDLDHELDREESRLKVRLAPEQRQAIKTALTSGLCIITGGPGTGKTMLQKALLGIYSRNHPSKEIVCCAPTGRAARRMEQSTGFPASTVHKALGLIAGEDGEYGTPETLDADLILVDEVSMLDIYLAGDLFDSVKPGSQLILIGDADQLPSVGPGAVLSEMIASGTIPVVKLDKIFRQTAGSRIATNAKLIRHGNMSLEYIRVLAELDGCLQTIHNAPVHRLSIRKAEDRLAAVEADIDRYRKLKISAYEDMRDGILSKEDYLDIKEQYEMRISEAQLAEEQIRHEIDLYIENGNAPQRWIQEFLDHRNIQSLTRIVAVECIDHIMIYEGKRIEVTFAHMQDYEALVSRMKDYYINQREVG